jgi:hypothetical protein
VLPFPRQFPRGDLPWINVTPQTLSWSLRHAAEVFGVRTFTLTENGAAFDDEVTPGGEILDLDRCRSLSGEIKLPQGEDLSTELNSSILVHAEDSNRRTSGGGTAQDHGLPQFKMLVPVLGSRVEQALNVTGVWVDA